jgi:hypothetical protein
MSEKYIARNSPLAARTSAGETMIMCAADSTFVILNEAATAIWQAADGKTPLSEIVSGRICREFDVDLHSANQDAERLVNELCGRGILLVSQQPIDSSVAAEAC